jgi:hypothetical protein
LVGAQVDSARLGLRLTCRNLNNLRSRTCYTGDRSRATPCSHGTFFAVLSQSLMVENEGADPFGYGQVTI